MKVEGWKCIAAFAAVFAAGVVWVFWGAWSPDFSPVMPDDSGNFGISWHQCLANTWNTFCANGKFHPTQLLWDNLVASSWWLRELRYVSGLFFAALATAWFLRGRGLSRPAACAGGLFLAFSGYWITLFSAGHGSFYVWMSYGLFAFGLIDRAVATGKFRYWLLLGLSEAWASFWQVDIWLLFAVFVAAWYVFSVIRVGFSKRILLGTLVAALVFAVVGAPGIRDAFGSALAGRDQQIAEGQTISAERQEKVDDTEKRWIFCTNWSLPPAEIAEFFIPRINGDTSCPLTLSIGRARGIDVKPYTGAIGRAIDAKDGNYRQHSLYIGFLTCLFALFALVSLCQNRGAIRQSNNQTFRTIEQSNSPVILFFALAAVFFCLCSFGRYFEPLYRIIFRLPFGDYLRAPVKWHHLTEFSVAVLGGFGVEAALRRFGSRRPVFIAICALVVFSVGDLAYHAHFYCAPIDMREARRTASSTQTTVLRREDFNRPEVKRMVQEKKLVSQAYYLGNPDLYLVDVLKPRKHAGPVFKSPESLPFSLGIISLIASLGILGFTVRSYAHDRR